MTTEELFKQYDKPSLKERWEKVELTVTVLLSFLVLFVIIGIGYSRQFKINEKRRERTQQMINQSNANNKTVDSLINVIYNLNLK